MNVLQWHTNVSPACLPVCCSVCLSLTLIPHICLQLSGVILKSFPHFPNFSLIHFCQILAQSSLFSHPSACSYFCSSVCLSVLGAHRLSPSIVDEVLMLSHSIVDEVLMLSHSIVDMVFTLSQYTLSWHYKNIFFLFSGNTK